MPENDYEPPKQTLGDHVHTIARAGIASIPICGGAANELFQAIIAPPMRKRQSEWMEAVAGGLRKLESERLKLEDLAENEEFIDTVFQASVAAMRTSQKQKREALCNAVLNSALPNAPDESRQKLFVGFIDTFSALHLRLLMLLDDPELWLAEHNITLQRVRIDKLFELVATAIPELAPQEVLCETVCRDLCDKGLLIASSLRKPINRFPYQPKIPREQQVGYRFADELPADGAATHSGSPTHLRNWTTELGREFLAFVSSPLPDESE